MQLVGVGNRVCLLGIWQGHVQCCVEASCVLSVSGRGGIVCPCTCSTHVYHGTRVPWYGNTTYTGTCTNGTLIGMVVFEIFVLALPKKEERHSPSCCALKKKI